VAIRRSSFLPYFEPGLKQFWLQQLQVRSYLYEGLVYEDFLRAAVELTRSQIGYFHLYSPEDDSIQLAVWSDGVFPICTTNHTSHYPLREAGIWADAIRSRKPVIHNDYLQYAAANGLPQGHFPVIRHLSIPIFQQEYRTPAEPEREADSDSGPPTESPTASSPSTAPIVAILGVGNCPDTYPDEIAAELMEFAHQAYPMVQAKVSEIEARRHRQMQLAQTDTLSLLIRMVSCLVGAAALRDEYTSQHSQNVADLSVAIAREMGLGEETILGLRLGALVHDIGKIAIPSEILTKPGKLNSAEYNLIKTHVERGAEIFGTMHFPWPILQMIQQHHERLNGSGYPLGIRSESILLEARIIAVADVFDSMSSSRPYRFAPGVDLAVAELRQGRSTLYDPYVVDALLRVLSHADLELMERYPSMYHSQIFRSNS
jgi:putative nucleotidyltransferase with HDIG domain